MIGITDQAVQLICELIDDAGLPDGSGLRIAQRDDHGAMAMTLSPEPGYHDTVVIERNATVFLGPAALDKVQGQTLDANITDTSTAFYLRD